MKANSSRRQSAKKDRQQAVAGRSGFGNFDNLLRQSVYRYFVRQGRAPKVAQIAAEMKVDATQVRAGLARLAESHAFVLQESGEIWRGAPFSAVPTAFPVGVGKRSYWANCIWDALGVPAMLDRDATIDAACGCCNSQMPLTVKRGKLAPLDGAIHFAVPARLWYQDIVFT